MVEDLARSLVEAAWTGYSGAALEYGDALAAMQKNPVWGVNLKNVLSWGRREAMQIAATDMEALETEVRGFLEEAVQEGTDLADFEARLTDALAARGIAPADPWHAETIFRTNVLAAYSGGQWVRAQDLQAAGRIEAAEYVAVRDDRTRPAHLAMNGWWGPLDSPTWAAWWPPNGWNCRCMAILLTPEEVEARGGIAAAPQALAVSPDPGFEGNPGTGLWQAVGKHMA